MAGTENVSPSEVEPPDVDGQTHSTGNEGALEVDNMPEEIREILEGSQRPTELTLDEIFELLKNSRRREVIDYLLTNTDGNARLDELAEHIAAKENDIEQSQLSSDQRKRVYIGLYQCHLPKMDDMGIIDFEKNRGTIALLPAVSQLEPYLARLEDDTEGQTPTVELAVTGTVLLAVVPAIVGVGPAASLSPTVLAILSTLAVVGLAAYNILG